MWHEQRCFTSWGFLPLSEWCSFFPAIQMREMFPTDPQSCFNSQCSACSPQVASLLPPSQVFVTHQTKVQKHTKKVLLFPYFVNQVISLVEMSPRSPPVPRTQLAQSASRSDPLRRDVQGLAAALTLVRCIFALLRIQGSRFSIDFPWWALSPVWRQKKRGTPLVRPPEAG